MDKYNAMFLITVIKANKYRFGYGRKWTIEKMKETVIALPGQEDGSPDFLCLTVIGFRQASFLYAPDVAGGGWIGWRKEGNP